MIQKILLRFRSFFLKGHERTLRAKKNIVLSLLLKGASIIVGLLVLPLTIRYVNTTQYGIWLTLSSIISWMNFFDIGLGNGLKNKLAESNALNQNHNSRIFVSTTYAILAIIGTCLFIVFYLAGYFINWNKILNTGASANSLNQVALAVFGLFCVQFVVQIVNTVLTAYHSLAKVGLILLIGQIITLIGILLLVRFTQSSLLLLVLVNGGVPVLVLIIASFWYYRHDLKEFSPSLRLVNFKYARELLSMGGVFFIIQIGALVLFQTDNIVIVQLFGPSQVTTFNVAYKLFSIFILGFNIIITPFWSAFTDAFAIGDYHWMRSVMKKMRYLWLLIVLATIVLFLLAPYIYRLWLNNTVQVPISLSFAMALYIVTYTWQTIHVYFLNGINKIRLQLYLVLVSAAVNIPLAIFLGRKIGLAGITLSNAGLFFFMGTIFYFQSVKLLNRTASGVWAK